MTYAQLDSLSKYAAIAFAPLVVAACSGESGVERDAETLSNVPAAGASAMSPGAMSPGAMSPGAMSPGAMSPGGGAVLEPGTGSELIVAEGWVDGATNGLGIQGAVFTYQDGSGRTLIAADATRTQTGYCVAGTAAQVLDGNFGGTYGAVAALNLSQDVGSEALKPYDATAHGVVGFGFDIVGNTGGALRFVVKQYLTHDGFCINNVPDCVSGCSVEYRIDELTQNCWTPGGPTPVPSSLQALEWQITTKESEATDFDYCIENIHAVVDASLAPATPAPAAPEVNVPNRSY